MSKPSPARHRATNWSSYKASLRKRGALLIWVDKDMSWRVTGDLDGQRCFPMRPYNSACRSRSCSSFRCARLRGWPPACCGWQGWTGRCHTAIIDRQATPIIPIRKNGRLWKENCPAARSRNETLRATRHSGRAFWKRWTGYHARSRIEAKMRSLNAFGERIMARDPDRQTAEFHIRIALMNRFNARATTAVIVRVA